MTGERRHFEEGGADYARHRPTYPPALADALADTCAATDHALDVGCGTGQLSTLLATRFGQVTATDPSETQIANAATHPRVAYAIEPAERIGLPDASADLVVAAQAAHWFDLDRFYAEARRVLHPGGALALVSYGMPQLAGPAAERFERFYWQDVHRHWPPGREHVEQGYRSLPFPFAEAALPPLTIERDWTLAALHSYVATWSATKRACVAGDGAAVERGLKEIAALWGDPARPRRITWPIIGRLAAIR